MTHEAFQFRFQFIYYQIRQPHFFHACPLVITTSVHERQTNQPPQIVYLINNFKVGTGRCADHEYYGAAMAHGRRKPISSHMGWTKWAAFTWMGTRGGEGDRWRIGKTFVTCFPSILYLILDRKQDQTVRMYDKKNNFLIFIFNMSLKWSNLSLVFYKISF